MSRQRKRRYSANFEFYEGTDFPSEMTLCNEEGKLDAPGDVPARVGFSRGGDVIWACWLKDDMEHRDHDLPSMIRIEEQSGRIELLLFQKNDLFYDHPCGFSYIWFNEDGTMEDEDGNLINPDLSKIPMDLGKRRTVTPFHIPIHPKPFQ